MVDVVSVMFTECSLLDFVGVAFCIFVGIELTFNFTHFSKCNRHKLHIRGGIENVCHQTIKC